MICTCSRPLGFVSGFIDALREQHTSAMSVMVDRGFTINDQLEAIGAKLNIPPFLDACQQLPAEEVQAGRQIASLRMHSCGMCYRESKKIIHREPDCKSNCILCVQC